MYSSRLLLGIVIVNIVLVLAIGVYGERIDEPLSREIGHGESLYDYLWWSGLAINGPSGYAALSLSSILVPGAGDLELRYWAQYGLWLLLLTPQWAGYHCAAVWCYGHRRREIALRITSVSIILLGCLAAYKLWTLCKDLGEFSNLEHCYSSFFAMAGFPLSGFIIMAYSRFGSIKKLAA
jgi:hypothetical protein